MVKTDVTEDVGCLSKTKKVPKRGIIYLSTIPPYMNVTRVREFFGAFGKVGRVYLQLGDSDSVGDKKSKKRKVASKFIEGWVEFERKSIAKQVASTLNNTQVNTRKKSKQYDSIWNIKYLSNFKWIHLHERLAYEKAARRQKLRTEIQLAKKKTNFFTANLDKTKNKAQVNMELENVDGDDPTVESEKDRTVFLQSLFA